MKRLFKPMLVTLLDQISSIFMSRTQNCQLANLRKAYKLTLKSVNPINNKQNVNFALSIFYKTTIAASKSIVQITRAYIPSSL